MKSNALRIDADDNVVTLLAAVESGEPVTWAEGCSVVAFEKLPMGHKVAIRAITPGGEIRKYGHPIGAASRAIAPGQWVHTHNLAPVER
jgi:altronate hydrolase